jgi:hypothetical protein
MMVIWESMGPSRFGSWHSSLAYYSPNDAFLQEFQPICSIACHVDNASPGKTVSNNFHLKKYLALWCPPYLTAKTSHMGVDMDGLACPLHCPMACCRQMRGQGFLSGMVLSCRDVAGGGVFSRGAKPLGLDI